MATILIVDDLATNREVLTSLLKYQGHHLVEAADGLEALSQTRQTGPDLIITDVLMPGMNGYELVNRLRADPVTQHIPVIFYTAHFAQREARELAAALGVSHVLTKPVEPEEVLAAVASAFSETTRPQPPDPAEFDRDHLRLLTDKLSESAEELRAANARLRGIINIGLRLASDRDPAHLLSTVCAAAQDLFGATSATMGVLNRDTRAVEHFLVNGVYDGERPVIGEPPAGTFQTVVATRKPVRTAGVVTVPLTSPSHVYGWLSLTGTAGRPLTADDEALLVALAGQVGRIYENGYFYAIAQRRADELREEMLGRQRSADALRETEERMRFALQAAGVGIWDIDYTTGVVRWSDVAERQHGFAPGTFPGTFEAYVNRIHPDDRQRTLDTIHRAMESGADFSIEHRVVWPDGSIHLSQGTGRVQLSDDGRPIRGVGISIDATARRLLEDQYRQAQKMEAIGRLAGGVAHDFNNLLTAILGFCELLLDDLDANDPHRADLEQIQHAGGSAAALTRQLLAFSRKQIIEPQPLILNTVIGETQAMLRHVIGEDVTIVLALSPDLHGVQADAGQIAQVILNLAVNARDAMPKGGTLTIETSNVELDDRYASTHLSVTPGPYVMLAISDTGTGITPEVNAHLFEPFFTTKEEGKGTGLGLATVYGIVTQGGGTIAVSTEVGRGSTFKIYLPAIQSAAEDATRRSRAASTTRGDETVLVVEDDDGLRELTRRILHRLGYNVFVAGNADEALAIVKREAGIDLLLTDVVMPGRSGPELAAELARQRPLIKVLFMSGYTDDAIVHHGVLKAGIALLHKPFTSDSLGRKLREVLDN